MFRNQEQNAGMDQWLSLMLAVVCSASAAAARDHERAREAQHRGEFVPLSTILVDAEKRAPGRVIDVELEDDDEYEVEVLRSDGTVVELDYDARTGRFIDLEVEDED